MKPLHVFLGVVPAASLLTAALAAQTPIQPDSARKLGTVTIMAERSDVTGVGSVQQLTLPVTASVTGPRIARTVNMMDSEDAVKYLPSLFLRKRNNGDTQATLATRVWGTSSSARSLIFADGVPLTALIANNNTIGGPRWGLVSPEEIARIDMMYGPFSAAYSGNSMGAVMEITTRRPERFTGSLQQVGALQCFDLYGTRDSFGTSQTNATIGDRFGRLWLWAAGNRQTSNSQPLAYVTSSSFPSGTTGGYAETNKLGASANILGATGLLASTMTNGKLRVGFDVSPSIQAAYTFALWRNDTGSDVASYLTNTAGRPSFAGQAGFATNNSELDQRHSSHSLTLKSNSRGNWDFEVAASRYAFDQDEQRFPTTAAANDTVFGEAGRAAVLDGTNWWSTDAKGAWHPGGPGSSYTLTFGAHADRYELRNVTYNTPEWRAGDFGTVATEGDGKTEAKALWAQSAWRLTSAIGMTVGGRFEDWRGFDGYNANGSTKVNQPVVSASNFSPKAVVAWEMNPDWRMTASVGKAYRFPTAAELYQLVTTGNTFTSPDPNLRPDNVLATELRLTRATPGRTYQLALFYDDVHDAIISQFLPLVAGSPTLYSYVSNVDHVRARGAELAIGATDVLFNGFDFSASVTGLDARTLALSGRASANAPAGSAVGKFLPNIPKWRATFVSTYRATERSALTVAGRYSGKVYTTLDNADVHYNTYQGFSEWFVLDARGTYQFDRHWSLTLGADNLLNRKYFLFHPFPQRTITGGAKLAW